MSGISTQNSAMKIISSLQINEEHVQTEINNQFKDCTKMFPLTGKEFILITF